MKSIFIQVVENGYIVGPHDPSGMTGYVPNVFESFENLTKWLKQNLEIKPQVFTESQHRTR